MLYSIAKKSGSRHEIKEIEKIPGKASKKRPKYSSNYSSDDSDSNSSLAINISRDTYRRPDVSKEMNKLDQLVTKNLKTTKYQLNEVIKKDLTFDTNIFNLSSGTSDPLPVLTVSL